MYRSWMKRILDFMLAFTGLVVLSPFMLLILLLLIFTTGGKPLFFQQRPGLHTRIFTLIKFRTMKDPTDKNGNKLTDKERLTPLGSFLRKTSVDELPQLINVIKGDMSLVGPRPLLVQYLPLYSPVQQRRHGVYPGITGWSQVNGRNAMTWTQKLKYDVWYVDNISFSLDIKIIFRTIKQVFLRRDVDYSEEVTMPEFDGNN